MVTIQDRLLSWARRIPESYAGPMVLRTLRSGSWTLLQNVGTKLNAIAILASGAIGDGVSGVGKISALYGAAILAASLSDFGYSSELGRFIASERSSHAVRMSARGVLLRIPLAIAFGALLGFFILRGASRLPEQALLVGGAAAAVLGTLGLSQVLYGLQRFRECSSTILFARIITVPLIISSAVVSHGEWTIAGVASGETVTCVALAILVVRVSRGLDTNATTSRPSVKYLWLGLGGVVNTLMNRSDATLAASAANPTDVGLYTFASQSENAVTTIALAPAASVPMAVAVATREHEPMRRPVLAAAAFTGALAAIGSLILIALLYVPYIREMLMSSLPYAQLRVVVILCMIGAPMSAATGVLLTASIGAGKHRIVGLSWIVIGSITAPTFWVLTHLYGAIGAGWGALVRDLVMLIVGLACWHTSSDRRHETSVGTEERLKSGV